VREERRHEVARDRTNRDKVFIRLKQVLGQFSSSALPLLLLNDLTLSAAFS